MKFLLQCQSVCGTGEGFWSDRAEDIPSEPANGRHFCTGRKSGEAGTSGGKRQGVYTHLCTQVVHMYILSLGYLSNSRSKKGSQW